jgi:hypothetical protein
MDEIRLVVRLVAKHPALLKKWIRLGAMAPSRTTSKGVMKKRFLVYSHPAEIDLTMGLLLSLVECRYAI